MVRIIFSFVLMVSFSSLMALSDVQKNKIVIAYYIGKKIKAKDGMTFENTLPSIMGQESSWGTNNLGDKYDDTGRLKSLYDSSLGNFQIKLATAKEIILKSRTLRKKYSHLVNKNKSTYKEYQKHKKKLEYYKSIIESKKWKNRAKRGEEKAISTIKWAKKNFIKEYNLFKKASKQARQDTLLINKLMYNFSFSAEVAGYYLLNIYEESCKKFGRKKAFWKAVGRYNGGWNNKKYQKLISKRMKVVKKIIKEEGKK